MSKLIFNRKTLKESILLEADIMTLVNYIKRQYNVAIKNLNDIDSLLKERQAALSFMQELTAAQNALADTLATNGNENTSIEALKTNFINYKNIIQKYSKANIREINDLLKIDPNFNGANVLAEVRNYYIKAKEAFKIFTETVNDKELDKSIKDISTLKQYLENVYNAANNNPSVAKQELGKLSNKNIELYDLFKNLTTDWANKKDLADKLQYIATLANLLDMPIKNAVEDTYNESKDWAKRYREEVKDAKSEAEFWDEYLDTEWKDNRELVDSRAFRIPFRQELLKIGFSDKINPFIDFLKKALKNKYNITADTYSAVHNAVANNLISLKVIRDFPDEPSNRNIIYSKDFYIVSYAERDALLDLQDEVIRKNEERIPSIFFKPLQQINILDPAALAASNYSTKLNPLTVAQENKATVLGDSGVKKQEFTDKNLDDIITKITSSFKANEMPIVISDLINEYAKTKEAAIEVVNKANELRSKANKEALPSSNTIQTTSDELILIKRRLEEIIFKYFKLDKLMLAKLLSELNI